jgi:N-acetylneuraminic acid mutarotase
MKKHVLIFLLALILINCSDDEDKPIAEPVGTWEQLKDIPTEGRFGSVSFSLLGKGYWGFGSNATSGALWDVWSYDPSTDSWTQKNDFPFYHPAKAAVSINDKGYVITSSGSLYEYSPDTDSWKYLSVYPTSIVDVTAFALNSNIYIGQAGGQDYWKYSPSQNQWTQVKDFPGQARFDAVSFVVGGKAYVGLGYGEQGAPPIHKDMYSYDPASDHWERIADFRTGNFMVGMVFSSDTKGYIGVAKKDTWHHGLVFEYDPTTDAWKAVKEFPSENSLGTRSFFLDNRMFVVGGWWWKVGSEVWEFRE